MNPLFIIFVFLTTIILWFLLAFLFKPIGKLVYKLVDDVKKAMEIDGTGKQNKEEKETE